MNDPTPAVDSVVQPDPGDLTELLMTLDEATDLGTDPETLPLIDTNAVDRLAPKGLEFGTTYY
jgi:hypothetical protein